MFQKASQPNYLEATSLPAFLFKWKKPLLIVCGLTLIASVIFSGESFIKPKYKSTVIFFPTATNSVSKALLDEAVSEKQDILAFGEEEQAEQLLQILNSDYIKNEIAEKYKLMQHYGIDPNGQYPHTRLHQEYNDNIKFSRTEFMSVRIDVMDTDPQMAADIANDISSLLDSTKTRMQRERAVEALKIIEGDLNEKKKAIQIKEDSLMIIRKKGMIDYRNQALVWNEEYAKSYAIMNNQKATLYELEKHYSSNDTAVLNTRARYRGAEASVKSLEEKLKILADYGGFSIALSEELAMERQELTRIQQQYYKLKVDAEQNLPHKFVVDKATKAEKKSYPIRWLIVLVSVSCVFILCCLSILMLEKYRNLNIHS